MKATRRSFNFAGRVALCVQLWSLVASAENKPADICASINTSDGESNVDIYQSFGACGDRCRGKFAFAILQDDKCWCSDYAPAQDTIVDDDKCNIKCPGYSEVCGGDGLFGYLSLSKKPAGTKGAGESTSSNGDGQASISVATKFETETVQNTVTFIPTTAGRRTSNTSPNDTPTTVQTVTADGTVRTVTIMPTAGVDSPNTAEISSSKKKGPSTGEIVGIVIGVALGIMLVVGIACFVKIRRRQSNNQGTFEVRNAASMGAGISGPAPGMSQTKGSNGFTTTRGIAAVGAAATGKRGSKLMPVDPRMDPDTAPGIYVRNKSHESVHTLHDEQDYSRRVHQPRVLRATNPDPDPDE